MKRFVFGLGLVIGLMFLSTRLWAATPATEFRLGVVDFQRALNAVDEGKATKARLEKEVKAKETEVKQKEEKLLKMKGEVEDLKTKEASNLLKPAEVTKLRKLEENFQQQYMDYMQSREKAGRETADKERAATEDILRKVRGIVEELGRAGNFTMVLEKSSGLVYAAEATDFTEKVIQKYNAQFKAAPVKAEKTEKK